MSTFSTIKVYFYRLRGRKCNGWGENMKLDVVKNIIACKEFLMKRITIILSNERLNKPDIIIYTKIQYMIRDDSLICKQCLNSKFMGFVLRCSKCNKKTFYLQFRLSNFKSQDMSNSAWDKMLRIRPVKNLIVV